MSGIINRIGARSGVVGLDVINQVATQSLSGSSNDFTIDVSAKRFTVQMNGASMDGAAHLGVQIGAAGVVETSGYSSTGHTINTGQSRTDMFLLNNEDQFDASSNWLGILLFEQLQGTETWVGSGFGGNSGQTRWSGFGGTKTLSGEITTVRIMTTGTFDAGTVSVAWE